MGDRRSLKLLVLCLVGCVNAVHAQAKPPAGSAPVAADADARLFRDATTAISRNDHRRADRLLRELRNLYPESPWVADSYYWHALSLSQRPEARAREEARQLLDEQELRFPEAGAQDEVVALRRLLDSVAASPTAAPPSALPAAACDASGHEAQLIDAMARLSLEPAQARARLAAMLASRTVCDQPLRRSAVLALDSRRLTGSEAMLRLVAERDPDSLTRERAKRALAGTLTPVPPLVLPLPTRVGRGAVQAFTTGDTVSVPLRFVAKDEQGAHTTLYSGVPLYLAMLHVWPTGTVELLAPENDGRAPVPQSGPLQLSALRYTYSVATENRQAYDAMDQRREMERERCEARALSAQMERDRRARPTDPAAGSRGAPPPTAPSPSEAPAARCFSSAIANKVPPPPPGSARETRSAKPELGYQVIIASREPVSRLDLVARLGTMPARPAETAGDIDVLVRALYGAQAAPWSAVIVGW